MATPTYEPIATITLSSNVSSVEFSSITQDYQDLILVFNGGINISSPISLEIQFNSDSSNGSQVNMEVNNLNSISSSTSSRMFFVTTDRGIGTIQIFDYSQTDKHKTILNRSSAFTGSHFLGAHAGRWASTSAITSIKILDTGGRDIISGTTLSLYGIEA